MRMSFRRARKLLSTSTSTVVGGSSPVRSRASLIAAKRTASLSALSAIPRSCFAVLSAASSSHVVEIDPRTWLRLVTGSVRIDDAAADGHLELSGTRAGEPQGWLPLVPLNP